MNNLQRKIASEIANASQNRKTYNDYMNSILIKEITLDEAAIIVLMIDLDLWAMSKLETYIGRGKRTRKIVNYYLGSNGTGAYFNCEYAVCPTYIKRES